MKFHAVIAPAAEMADIKTLDNYAKIEIWADDVAVYSKSIDSNGEAIIIDLDLTGV